MNNEPVSLDFATAQPVALDFSTAEPVVAEPEEESGPYFSSIADVIEGIEALDLNADTGDVNYDPSRTGMQSTYRRELCNEIGFPRWKQVDDNAEVIEMLFKYAEGLRQGLDLSSWFWGENACEGGPEEYRAHMALVAKARATVVAEMPGIRHKLVDGWRIVWTEHGRKAFTRFRELLKQLEEQAQ